MYKLIKMNKVSNIPLQKSSPSLLKLNLTLTPQHLKSLEETKLPSPIHYKIKIEQCKSERALK